MHNPRKFKITFYLASCGAQSTHHFSDKAQYEKAREFLDALIKFHIPENELPPELSSAGVNDYYYVDESVDDAFKNFMRQVIR